MCLATSGGHYGTMTKLGVIFIFLLILCFYHKSTRSRLHNLFYLDLTTDRKQYMTITVLQSLCCVGRFEECGMDLCSSRLWVMSYLFEHRKYCIVPFTYSCIVSREELVLYTTYGSSGYGCDDYHRRLNYLLCLS